MDSDKLPLVAVRGAVYYPPISPVARVLALIDSWLRGLTTFAITFIALIAVARTARGEP